MVEHRAGPLRQSNKPHKPGKHKSNRSRDFTGRGKVAGKSSVQLKRLEQNRTERKNRAKQIRNRKREELKERQRLCGSFTGPSQLLAFISLSDFVDLKKIKFDLQKFITLEDGGLVKRCPFETNGSLVFLSSKHKHKFSFIECPRDLFSTLEIVKIADCIVFVVSSRALPDEFGELIIKCLLAWGMPSSVTIIQGLTEVPMKVKKESKNSYKNYIQTYFQQEKLFTLDSELEASLFIRHLSHLKRKQLSYRIHHSFVLAENINYDSEFQSLAVTGYVRGAPLNVNHVVSIKNYGNYLVEKIVQASDSLFLKKPPMNSPTGFVVLPDSDLQEDLITESYADSVDLNQPRLSNGDSTGFTVDLNTSNLPTKNTLRAPKGTSSYQATWMVDEYERSEDEYEDLPVETDDEFQEVTENLIVTNSDQVEEVENLLLSSDETDKYDEENTNEDDLAAFKKLKSEKVKDDLQFPDEVDTPLDVPARIRFRNYRGLQSFRDTPWNPKENLPLEYSRIFKFVNFGSACSAAKKEVRTGIAVGSYVTVYLRNVPKEVLDSHNRGLPFVLNFLLRFEHKMTVLNILLKRVQSNQTTVKSKDDLVFLTPHSMFRASTLFSQHTRYDKHKLERYFHSQHPLVMATVYAPNHYTPCPVLAFNIGDNGTLVLLATGRVWSSDPDRIILKRVILTGDFYKIYVKSCVLRFLFFNRDDVNWFKPIELETKFGLKGHIREPLGTHGYMKCAFNGRLRGEDTVCLKLYKRVFPDWNFRPLAANDVSLVMPMVQNVSDF